MDATRLGPIACCSSSPITPQLPQCRDATRPAARQPKHRGRQHPQPQTRGALEAHDGGASGTSMAARAPPVDSIAAMISAASRTPTSNSWWFSAQHRLLRVDLERSAPRRRTSSAIMMVTSAPARPDHLALIGSACTPPAGHCTAAAQRGEQKRSIVNWRICFSTALWSAIARAMSAGAAHAGAEGALTGSWALFPARNWGLKSTGFQCTIPPPIYEGA